MNVRICAVDELAPAEARRFDVEGHRIAVVRVGDELLAVGDRCTHADYSLSEGEVWPDECMIECPKHGSRFSLRDGEPDSLPATRPVPVYDLTVDGGDVLVDLPATDGPTS